MPSITAYLGFEVQGQTIASGFPETIRYALWQLRQISSWEIVDSWGEVDDTIRLTFNEEALSAKDIEGADVVCAVVDGRFFGPYDIQPVSVVPAYSEYTIRGRQDRRFEHTALDASDALAVQAATLLGGQPYIDWESADTRATIVGQTKTAIESSRTLSEMRSALRDYGLSVFPDDTSEIVVSGAFRPPRLSSGVRLLGNNNVLRRIRAAAMAPVVPTSVSDTLQLTYANLVDIDGVIYPHSVTRRAVPRVHPETQNQSLRDTEYSLADVWNAPGSYRSRHIVCGVREPGTGLVSVQPPPDTIDAILRHRQIELDMVQATAGSARWAIAAERWRLQHESMKASATWPQGLIELAPNRLVFNVARDSTDLWRAVTVKHRGQGAHYNTNAEFALYQGSA